MADTLEDSLRSILNQITDEYEVLVIDGGSTDGSITILNELVGEYSNLRVLCSTNEGRRYLGADRALSVSEAKGEYILTHVDTDDRYDKVIPDLVKLFHEIESQIESRLFLYTSHILMASKKHLLTLGSYRNLRVAEDLDLCRRALTSNNTTFIIIDSDPFWEQIGYVRTFKGRILRLLEIHTCDFQVGITFRSSFLFCFRFNSLKWSLLHISLIIIAYLISTRRRQFKPVEDFRSKEKYYNEKKKRKYTISELEMEFGFSIDRSIFTNRGKKYLLNDIDGYDARFIYPKNLHRRR